MKIQFCYNPRRTIEYCFRVSFDSQFRHIRGRLKTEKEIAASGFSVASLRLRSCSLNTYTKVLMNGNSSTSRVSVQIFSFVNLDVLYLHCQVQVCVQIGSVTCVPVSTSSDATWIHPKQGRKHVVVPVLKKRLESSLCSCFLAGLSAKNGSVFKHNWNSFRFFRASAEIRWRWALLHYNNNIYFKTFHSSVVWASVSKDIFSSCMPLPRLNRSQKRDLIPAEVAMTLQLLLCCWPVLKVEQSSRSSVSIINLSVSSF